MGGGLKSLADFGDKEGFLADKKSKYDKSLSGFRKESSRRRRLNDAFCLLAAQQSPIIAG